MREGLLVQYRSVFFSPSILTLFRHCSKWIRENELVIIYKAQTLNMSTKRLVACFLRLADPETGRRLEDIRFQP